MLGDWSHSGDRTNALRRDVAGTIRSMNGKTEDWPDVVFQGSGLRDVAIDEACVATLFRHLAADLSEVPLQVVRKVIVANSDLYGDVIREELGAQLQDSEPTHTERPQYTGVAKTLPVYHPGDTVENTIVLRAGVVAAALNIDGVEPMMESYLGRYIIQHELSHCWDNIARRQPAPVRLSDGEFSISRVGVYYKRILMAEFIACAMSGARLEHDNLNALCRMDAEPLDEEIRTILDVRSAYRLRAANDLRKVAFTSSQCAWLVLVQYAKVFGHMVGGGRASAAISLPAALNQYPEAVAVIHDLARLLGAKINEYPNWPEDGWTELDTLWDRLARSLGFRFETMHDGSALWFD